MNEEIREYLDRYVQDPDPQYAVALCGKWGCGKSYFVDKWVAEMKDRHDLKPDADDYVLLKPILVSLFGMHDVSDVMKALDRAINPILHSKPVKFLQKFANLAGQVVLKTDLKIGDTQEASMEVSLDSLSVFLSNDSKIQGDKLLIFDDFERSQIDLKEMLGFINSLIERNACHVVVIGDFTKLRDEDKKIYDEFREKTFGRMFEIMPETEKAIDCFITEYGSHEWLIKNKGVLMECFREAGTSNLRIMRHAVRDLSAIFAELKGIRYEHSRFMLAFVATFVMVTYLHNDRRYAEMLNMYVREYIAGLGLNEDYKPLVMEMEEKFKALSVKLGVGLLDAERMEVSLDYLEKGRSIKRYITDNLALETREPTLLERLENYANLEEEEFAALCKEAERRLREREIDNPVELGKMANLLARLDSEELFSFDDMLKDCVAYRMWDLFNSVPDAESVEQMHKAFRWGILTSEALNKERVKELCEKVSEGAMHSKDQVANEMQKLIRNLTDENVAELEVVDDKTVPDGQSAYNLTPIFYMEDANDFFDMVQKLTNRGRNRLNSFFRQHYHLSGIMMDHGMRIYKNDLPFLTSLNNRITFLLEDMPKGVTRKSYQALLDTLNEIDGRIQHDISGKSGFYVNPAQPSL